MNQFFTGFLGVFFSGTLINKFKSLTNYTVLNHTKKSIKLCTPSEPVKNWQTTEIGLHEFFI